MTIDYTPLFIILMCDWSICNATLRYGHFNMGPTLRFYELGRVSSFLYESKNDRPNPQVRELRLVETIHFLKNYIFFYNY